MTAKSRKRIVHESFDIIFNSGPICITNKINAEIIYGNGSLRHFSIVMVDKILYTDHNFGSASLFQITVKV